MTNPIKPPRSTHLNSKNQPEMVDISQKNPTVRIAKAQALVRVPWVGDSPVDDRSQEWLSPKGPVIQTAIIAGIQGAKETSRLIPLCHSLGLTSCSLDIIPKLGNLTLEFSIFCVAKTTGQTGVEMEALTGATLAALTIYDMAKSVVKDIEITEIKLLEKTGGKSDYQLQNTQMIHDQDTFGKGRK